MNQGATILLVEDDRPQRLTLGGFLRKRGHEVLEADSASAAMVEAGRGPVDLLITDLRLGGPDGVTLLISLRQRNPEMEGLIITAYGSVEDAVRAMKAGAYDFMSKPLDLERLEALVEKALERVRLARENRGLREVVKSAGVLRGLIGRSPAMERVRELALKVAASRASVLILGESGTGKEVMARSIHLASPRHKGPFIAVSCAALTDTLIESELFGHERGAFTGAAALRKGRFELAHGGTLFLDEVGDIPLSTQVKLLHVLQSSRFERVGGTETIEVDVRVIAATNRDLRERMAGGQFREDLYYRLNVVTITMPPLRERGEDIVLLVDHFLQRQRDLTGKVLRGVEGEVLDRMRGYGFPGNVRELENWVERAVVLAEGERLTREDFPDQLFDGPVRDRGPGGGGLEEEVASLERGLIREALAKRGGNQSAAARDLRISERAIRYKMKKYGL